MADPPQATLARWYDQAVTAFQREDFHTTAGLARNILARAPATPDVHHLLALAQAQLGDVAGASSNYEAALRGKPDDPMLCSNYAAFLRAAGEDERALSYYRRALVAAPDRVDALLGVGLTARRLGYFAEAAAALDKALKLQPSAPVLQALGLLHRELGNLDEAAAAFRQAAQLAPDDFVIALSHARVEMERGGTAAPLYDRAAAIAPDHPDIVLGKARIAVEENDTAKAVALLEAALELSPEWTEGHRSLSGLRWQLGEGAASTRSYEAAIAARPNDFALHQDHILILQGMQRYAEAATAVHEARDRFPDSTPMADLLDQLEAVVADEAGDLALASNLFVRSRPETRSVHFRIAYARHLLRARQIEEAASVAESLVAESGDGEAWAYLGTAWRMLGDSRYEWLECDERLVSVVDLAEIIPHLDALSTTLRRLHVGRAHPFDQSLRGGTQTSGDLLVRCEPELQQLRAAFVGAVREYIAKLPPPDSRHPTLSQPRGAFRFTGSWSVRLSSQGFHINHVHPSGWLSSAFYVSLPPNMSDGGETAGWLTLGQPSPELGLDLAPRRLVEPKPGRLVIFPSHMWHGTVPFEGGERLTVAFDVAPIKDAPAP